MSATTAKPILNQCSILLLAGGRGQRMGGQDKGWVQWQGRALIEWMHQVVRPLTDDLIISCNRHLSAYAPLADQTVMDPVPDYPGPLIGIIEALRIARHPWLLVLPCDAPLIDEALLRILAAKAGPRPVMLRQDGQWQPLFSLIPAHLLPWLEQQWLAGQRSPLRAMLQLEAEALELSPEDRRLDNFNDPQMLNRPLLEGLAC